MPALQGEFFCKVDSKGRVHMPGKLLSQLHEQYRDKFVINRGFETHLNIYPRNVWDRLSAQMTKHSTLNANSRKTMRFFLAGASYLELDSAERILLSKQQQMYAQIQKKVVLLAYKNKIEVWSEELYMENFIKTPDMDTAGFSQEILNDIDDNIDVLEV